MVAKRACCHGERGMKGILDCVPRRARPPGALGGPAVDNAPIRRCVPRNAIPFTGETQNYVKTHAGRVLACVRGDPPGGGGGGGGKGGELRTATSERKTLPRFVNTIVKLFRPSIIRAPRSRSGRSEESANDRRLTRQQYRTFL